MKKLFILFGLLLLTAIATFAQQVTDTIPIVHTQGENILAFLKTNAWNLALIVFLLISEWLGSTGKVKEGSIYAWILNFIGKIIRSKTDLVTTKKAMYMTSEQYNLARKSLKILILALLLSGIGITVGAQSRWSGFFKPVDQYQFQKTLTAKAGQTTNPFVVKFRPTVSLNGGLILYNPDTKIYDVSALSGTGIGVSIAKYIESNGEPYTQFAVNALAMLTWQINEVTQARVSPVVGITYMKFLSTGVGYLTGPSGGRTTGQRIFFTQNVTYNF
jgi:hypothetical protein